MAGCVQDVTVHLPNTKTVAALEQFVELAAIALKLSPLIEDFAKGVLHDLDVLTNSDLSAQMVLQIGGCGKVISMNVGLKDPLDL